MNTKENLCTECGAKYDDYVQDRGFIYFEGKPYCMKCYPKYHKIAAARSLKAAIELTKNFNATLRANSLI